MKAPRLQPALRNIEPSDVDRLTAMDEQLTHLRRRDWYERKTSPTPGDVHVSLGAEVDGLLVGAILGSLRRGEFGIPEPIAVLDTILVDGAYQGRGIATALLKGFAENLRRFGVRRLRTEISWDESRLNGFLTSRGFLPVARTLLDLDMGAGAGAKADEAGANSGARPGATPASIPSPAAL